MCDYNQHPIGWAKKILWILFTFFLLVGQTGEICWGKESDVADVAGHFLFQVEHPPTSGVDGGEEELITDSLALPFLV